MEEPLAPFRLPTRALSGKGRTNEAIHSEGESIPLHCPRVQLPVSGTNVDTVRLVLLPQWLESSPTSPDIPSPSEVR